MKPTKKLGRPPIDPTNPLNFDIRITCTKAQREFFDRYGANGIRKAIQDEIDRMGGINA